MPSALFHSMRVLGEQPREIAENAKKQADLLDEAGARGLKTTVHFDDWDVEVYVFGPEDPCATCSPGRAPAGSTRVCPVERRATTLKRQHAVEWGNPYTDPPDGMERQQLYVEVPYEDSSTPSAILEKLENLGGLGSGWSHCVGFVEPPRRELPLASKQSIRRKRLKARLEKKYPLFADLFYAEALREKPEYYGAAGATSPDVPSHPPKETSPR
ncbi:hypothetical protein GBA65_21800 (plasmid) [Rubrobacter marinus]|uniref:Uncharacterized protein n=1 Tax=Rubrobacter marinus TaxID=2653852 RepID=A0A6G8Q3J7_9ACTN|nr:hypothetical protein [Rubrobacter marinus]QIN81074.1 hypothetical protein GBA65_21800 [Rubrobacter marinus]